MQEIKQSLQNYHPVNQQIADFKAAFEACVNRKLQLLDIKSIKGLQEDLTVEPLYWADVIHGPITLFRLLRDYLVIKGFQCVQHSNINKLRFRIAFIFIDNEEDRYYAFQRLATLRISIPAVSPINPQSVSFPGINVPREQEGERRLSHNIS